VLYECLTGEPVFPRSSRLAVAWAHLEEDPPRASRQKRGVPEAVDRVIARALAKQPGDRYPSCGALAAAAEQALGLRRSTRFRTAAIVAGAVAVAIVASFAVVQLVGRRGAAVPPRTHANSLVRIDPKTNKVQDVIDVAPRPWAVAAWGPTVWVYSRGGDVVSEIEGVTSRPLRATQIPARPLVLHPAASGPVLAADPYGAWVVGLDHKGHGAVVLVPKGGGRPRKYGVGGRPVAVTTGLHAVWIVDDGNLGDRLIRLDPASGRVTAEADFPVSSGVDAVTVGFKDVWIVGGRTGTLYRFDPHVHSLSQHDLGARAGRPAAIFGHIWVGVSGYGEQYITLVNPQTLNQENSVNGGVGTGIGSDFATAFGSLWGYDVGNGEVQGWHPPNPAKGGAVQVTDAPAYDGNCMTSLTAGDHAVWVTLAPPIESSCRIY